MAEKYQNEEHQKPVGKMSPEEMEIFLAKGYTLRLACLKPNGDPFVIPCWHHWESKNECENGSSCDCINGCFWVIPRSRSKWAEYLKNDPRCSWVVDDDQTMEKIQCDGTAELVEESVIEGRWVGIAEKMAVRYLGPDGPTYLEPTLNQPRWLFRLHPKKLRSWQGVGWAKSYWVKDTGGPSWQEAHNKN